jgi:subtilisin-like proprotein convertase family protein
MDAEAMVTRARHWINVPPQMNETLTPESTTGKASKNAPFKTTLNYSGNISYLEHVVVVISISADPRGDIQINLESPNGTNVTLLQNRPNDIEAGKYNEWPFMSVMFWGENPNGEWTLTISNRNSSDADITVEKFEFYGVLYTPMVIARIPGECHSDLRNAHTLECINNDKCPPGYAKHHDYCYKNETEPIAECESPLKYKIENECNTNYGGCERRCTYAYTSRQCSCDDGYMLDANRKNCQDIDECTRNDNETHGCNGMCMNNDGSYRCTNGCQDGYCLEEDINNMKRVCTDRKECDTDNGGCQHLCWELPGSFQCDCYPGYTLDSDNRNCSVSRFIPLEMNSSNIEGDDIISPEIDFPEFPVGCKYLTKVYVGTNGYFTFDGFTGFTPFKFSQGNGLSLVAPFFIDIADTTDTSGRIKYEFNDDSTSEVAKSVNRIIRREKDPYFRGTHFLIASWEEVSPYSNPNIKITFQGILATNQSKTFAIFTYKCDGNKFPDKPTVGYVTKDGMVFNYDDTLQNNPYQMICISTTDEYVNMVLDISECNPPFDACKQEC